MPEPTQQAAETNAAPESPPANETHTESLDTAFSSAMREATAQQPADPEQPAEPSPQAPPAEPQTPPAPQPQEPQVNPVLEQARAAGLNLNDDATTEQIAQAVLQQYQQAQPFIAYGQQVMPHAQQFQNYLQSQQTQQQPEQPAETDEWDPQTYFQEKWQANAWTPEMQHAVDHGIVVQDARGNWVAATGYEMLAAQLLPQINQAHEARRQQVQQLFDGNPYENFYEVLREPMQRQWQADIDAAVERRLQETQARQSVDEFERQAEVWMYQTTPAGQKVLSDQGKAFMDQVETLQKAGMTDPNTIIQIAQQLAGVDQQPAAPAAPQPAANTPQAPSAQQTQPAEQQQSFLDNARARAQHSPSVGGGNYSEGDEPVVQSPSELNSMFSRAFKEQINGSAA